MARPKTICVARGCALAHLRRMEILRHVLPQLVAGCIGGIVASAGLIATNLGSLRDLILHSENGWIAGLLLTFGFALSFGYAALARAIDQAIGQEE